MSIGIWCIVAVLLYAIWVFKSQKKEYYVVEWRTLNPEGADFFSDWSDAFRLSKESLAVRGCTIDGFKIMRGDQWIAGRTLAAWQSYDAAVAHFENCSKYGPEPHHEACFAILWAVKAPNEDAAIAKVREGLPLLLSKSAPRRVSKE
jgi:hypothetical protein